MKIVEKESRSKASTKPVVLPIATYTASIHRTPMLMDPLYKGSARISRWKKH